MEAIDDRPITTVNRGELEHAHYEICTALTVLRSNVELVRVELRSESDPALDATVRVHLLELDAAIDRLQSVARSIRVRKGNPS